MKVITKKEEVKSTMEALSDLGKSIGFVPTMGALHEGHLALIEKSLKENEVTVCSIFVNPLQFNNSEDFKRYPNTFDADKQMLAEVGCHFLFAPIADEFYHGVAQKKYDFGLLSEIMEASYRPGHFEGVATVISEFFQVIEPTRAYFGEKDYQQLAIVRWLVAHENFNSEIISCPTVRNESGLALSSRNQRLSKKGVKEAEAIYQTMAFCVKNAPHYPLQDLAKMATQKLQSSMEVEYLEILEERSFQKMQEWNKEGRFRVFIAAQLEGIRLIDNLSLNP